MRTLGSIKRYLRSVLDGIASGVSFGQQKPPASWTKGMINSLVASEARRLRLWRHTQYF